MAIKARYNSKGWPLTLCSRCARFRYCEPHGTTAACVCSPDWTESVSIPYRSGDTHISLTAKERHALIADGPTVYGG
jgi:hypothetical protein